MCLDIKSRQKLHIPIIFNAGLKKHRSLPKKNRGANHKTLPIFFLMFLTVNCATNHVTTGSILSFLMTFNHMRIRIAPYYENQLREIVE